MTDLIIIAAAAVLGLWLGYDTSPKPVRRSKRRGRK